MKRKFVSQQISSWTKANQSINKYEKLCRKKEKKYLRFCKAKHSKFSNWRICESANGNDRLEKFRVSPRKFRKKKILFEN